MKCVRCRSELSDEAIFCPECGLKIDTKDASGEDAAPAPSGLPGLPTLSMETSPTDRKEKDFVPSSYDQITPAVTNAVPNVYSHPAAGWQQPASGAQGVQGVQGSVPSPYHQGGIAAPMYMMPHPPIDESDYYHIDATERYNFEAFRGISIVSMVISVLTMIGILFPLPICIVTLVLSCLNADERDPARARSRFNTCRVLSIISIISVFILIILRYVLRYLANYTQWLNLY